MNAARVDWGSENEHKRKLLFGDSFYDTTTVSRGTPKPYAMQMKTHTLLCGLMLLFLGVEEDSDLPSLEDTTGAGRMICQNLEERMGIEKSPITPT